MNEKQLPELIDPYRFAEQGISLDGVVFIKEMDRLQSSLVSQEGAAKVRLSFGRDEQGLLFVKGHVQTLLNLQCQRCMEPYNYEIISNFVLGIVESVDDVRSLPTHYEPAIIEEGGLALRKLIEDEIILNLPLIPKHEANQCKIKLPLRDEGWTDEKEKNPFHVLASLKKRK